tara:strand:+ start:72 stop:329 length:258 start_codon:yes stop_codon:yes gene_type:complete
MVFNCLTFNHPSTDLWKRAKKFHSNCLANVFSEGMVGYDPTPSKYAEKVEEQYRKAREFVEQELERTRKDETAEKKVSERRAAST